MMHYKILPAERLRDHSILLALVVVSCLSTFKALEVGTPAPSSPVSMTDIDASMRFLSVGF